MLQQRTMLKRGLVCGGVLLGTYVVYRIVKSRRPVQEAAEDARGAALGAAEGATGRQARVLVDISVWGMGSADTSNRFLQTAAREVAQLAVTDRLVAAGGRGAAYGTVYSASHWRKLVPFAERRERAIGLKGPPLTSVDYAALQARFTASAMWKPDVDARVPFSFCGDAPLSAWVFVGAHTARSSITAGRTSSDINQRTVVFPISPSVERRPFPPSAPDGDGDDIVLYVTSNPRYDLTEDQKGQIIAELGGHAAIIRVKAERFRREESNEEMAELCAGAQAAVSDALAGLPRPPPKCAVVVAGPAQLAVAVGRALATSVGVGQRPGEVITFELYADPESTANPVLVSQLPYVRAFSWRG